MSKVSVIRARVARYRMTVAWVLRDAIRAARARIIGIVVVNAAGVGLATGSMGLVLRYIHWAQQPQPRPIVWFGIRLVEQPGFGPLAATAALALLLGVASASLIYSGDRSLLRLARDSQTRYMRGVLRGLRGRRLGTLMLDYERRLGESAAPTDLLLAGTRYSALALRTLIQLFLPTLTLLVSLAALIVIDWVMTAVLVMLALGYLAPLYRINESVARYHQQYRKTSRHVPRTIGSSLTVMVGTSGPIRELAPSSEGEVFSRPEFQQMQDGLFGRMLATKRLVLLNSVFLIGFVALVLLAFSRHEVIVWTSLLAYLLAVRFTWSGVRQVTALLTSFNQIYLELERVVTFVRLTEEREAATLLPPPFKGIEFANTSRHPLLANAPRRIRIERGALVVLLDARRIEGAAMDRALALLASKAELGGDHLTVATVHDAPRLVPALTLLQHVFGDRTPTPEESADLDRILEEGGVAAQIRALPDGLRTLASPDLPLTMHCRFLIGIAYLLLKPPVVVLMNLQSLADLKPRMRRLFFGRFANSVFLLMDKSTKTWAEDEEIRTATTHAFVLLDRGEVLAGEGTWLVERQEAVEAVLASLAAARRETTDLDRDETEEFLEDD